MKKLLATLLMIALLVPQTAFAAAKAGWSIEYQGNKDRNTHFAEVSDEVYRYGGQNSLCIQWSGSATAGDSVSIKNTFETPMPEGSYTLKFMYRGFYSSSTEITIGEKTFAKTDFTKGSDVVSPADESKKWNEYKVEFDYTGASAESLTVTVVGGTTKSYMDDVSLVNNTTGTEYIVDGGFEDYEEAEEEEKPYDRTNYAAKQVRTVAKGTGAVAVSWINPKTSDLSSVTLYDITDGNAVLVAEGLDATPGKSVYREISDLENGKVYVYKVVFGFGKKGSDTYFTYGAPSSSTSGKKGSWSVGTFQNGTAGYCPAEVSIDSTVGHESSSSLKFVTNIDGSNVNALSSNIYAVATQSVNLMSGKYYVSFYMKSKNMSDKPRATMDFTLFEDGNLFLAKPAEDDWTHYECIYDYDDKGKSTITFSYDRICDALWIDDVVIKQYNTETNQPEGDNLVSDSGFENLVSETAGVVSTASATGGVGSVTISDYDITGSYSKIDIYQEVFKEGDEFHSFEYRGSIPGDVTSFEVTDLKKDEDVTFRLVPVNTDGISGTGKEVTAHTVLPDYEIGEAALYNPSGVRVEEISETGKYNVKISIKNSKIDGKLPYEALGALYKDGALIKLFSKADGVKKTGKSANPTEVKLPVDIEEAGNWTLEFYLIDSRSSLAHYCKGFSWTVK